MSAEGKTLERDIHRGGLKEKTGPKACTCPENEQNVFQNCIGDLGIARGDEGKERSFEAYVHLTAELCIVFSQL